jgi:LacI family transcriptional regulator
VSQPDPGPAYRLGRELLAGHERADAPSAIFATSDTIAIGLLRAAYQAGVGVPDRLSIVGYDNIDIAAFTIPPLTTVSQSGVEMGRTAATLLLDMIDHDRAAAEIDDVVMAPTLVVRESTSVPYPGLGQP